MAVADAVSAEASFALRKSPASVRWFTYTLRRRIIDRATTSPRKGSMKLLLTSAGIKNTSIHNALVDLLGKPIAESSALIIPTAIYPFPGGGRMAWRAILGTAPDSFADWAGSRWECWN